jgi:putative copper resistance protein D
VTFDPIEIAARALSDALSLALFGAALLSARSKRDHDKTLRTLAFLTFAVSLAAAASVIARVAIGADIPLSQISSILLGASFGRVWLIRCALSALTATFAIGKPRPMPIAIVAGLNLAALALTGHAGARVGAFGSVIIALHVIAGGAWFGGLLLLLRSPTEPGQVVQFSRLGYAAASLAPLAGLTALFAITGIPVPNLHTAYGRLVALKLGLYGVVLALAIFNRFVVAPRANWGLLRRTVGAEIVAMTGLVVTAATLSATSPEG